MRVWTWMRARWLWLFGAVLAASGAGLLVRRFSAARLRPGTLGLAIHQAEVTHAEADIMATKAHRIEMARIRRQVEAAKGAAARVELDRASVLNGMDLDAALAEMRNRARELGL